MRSVRNRLLHPVLYACPLVMLAVPAFSDTILDTATNWQANVYVTGFGHPTNYTPTYGQVVTVPAIDTVLHDFTFYIQAPTSLVFRGEVYAWDGSRAVGSPTVDGKTFGLFESVPTHTLDATKFEPITFQPGDLTLTAGSKYVLFASVATEPAVSGSGKWGFTSDAYSGGQFYYQLVRDDPGLWTSQAWSTFGAQDLAFKATFTSPTAPVPEIGGLAMLTNMGLGGAFLLWRRRRQYIP